jgi:hypothetical protein
MTNASQGDVMRMEDFLLLLVQSYFEKVWQAPKGQLRGSFTDNGIIATFEKSPHECFRSSVEVLTAPASISLTKARPVSPLPDPKRLRRLSPTPITLYSPGILSDPASAIKSCDIIPWSVSVRELQQELVFLRQENRLLRQSQEANKQVKRHRSTKAKDYGAKHFTSTEAAPEVRSQHIQTWVRTMKKSNLIEELNKLELYPWPIPSSAVLRSTLLLAKGCDIGPTDPIAVCVTQEEFNTLRQVSQDLKSYRNQLTEGFTRSCWKCGLSHSQKKGLSNWFFCEACNMKSICLDCYGDPDNRFQFLEKHEKVCELASYESLKAGIVKTEAILKSHRGNSVKQTVRRSGDYSLDLHKRIHITFQGMDFGERKMVPNLSTRVSLSLSDMLGLLGSSWLTSDVLDAFFAIEKGQDKRLKLWLCEIWYHLQRKASEGEAEQWKNRLQPDGSNLLFIPVNWRNTHWAAITICYSEKEITYYDSIEDCSAFARAKSVLDPILPLIEASNWKFVKLNASQQENGTDCGVFIAGYFKFVLSSLDDVGSLPLPTQAEMNSLRHTMTARILDHFALPTDTQRCLLLFQGRI